MAKIQQFKRLTVESFDAKDQDLVSKIASAINPFADDIQSALNNNLTIADNLNIVYKDFTIIVDSSGNPTNSAIIKTGLDHVCLGIQVIRSTNLTTPTTIATGTPFITFSENSGLITIQNVTNLVANNQYKLKLILF